MQQLATDCPAQSGPELQAGSFTPGILDKLKRLNNMGKLISMWKGVGNCKCGFARKLQRTLTYGRRENKEEIVSELPILHFSYSYYLNAAEPQPYFQTSVAEARLAVSHETGAKPPSEP
jgi:hypothetical protein